MEQKNIMQKILCTALLLTQTSAVFASDPSPSKAESSTQQLTKEGQDQDSPIIMFGGWTIGDIFKEAKKNNPTALKHLSACYKDGIYCKKDEKKAFEIAKKAAETGDDQAIALLGRMYARGTGTNKDISKALEVWKPENKTRLSFTWQELAFFFSNPDNGKYYDMDTATIYFRLLALHATSKEPLSGENKIGFAGEEYQIIVGTAQFMLAQMLDSDKWYERAINNDFPQACHALGDKRQKSNDPIGAVEAYRRCKGIFLPSALVKIGELMLDTSTEYFNPKLALKALETAKKRGHPSLDARIAEVKALVEKYPDIEE